MHTDRYAGQRRRDLHYTLDKVSSVILLTNNDQATAYTYGITLTTTGTQAGINHCRYATGHPDPTGLVKLGARYCNPTLGRFTQTDPSGQETNRYACACDNPTTNNDPTGLCTEDDGYSYCAPSCSWGECYSDYNSYDWTLGCFASSYSFGAGLGLMIVNPAIGVGVLAVEASAALAGVVGMAT